MKIYDNTKYYYDSRESSDNTPVVSQTGQHDNTSYCCYHYHHLLVISLLLVTYLIISLGRTALHCPHCSCQYHTTFRPYHHPVQLHQVKPLPNKHIAILGSSYVKSILLTRMMWFLTLVSMNSLRNRGEYRNCMPIAIVEKDSTIKTTFS